VPDREAARTSLAVALQATWVFLLRPLLRAVRYSLDIGTRNFWLLVSAFLMWYIVTIQSGVLATPEAKDAYFLTEISVFGIPTPLTYAQALIGFVYLMGGLWLYKEVSRVFWDLVALGKRVAARALLVSLYLLYRILGKESEAVYYLDGPPTLKERLEVYGAMGALVLVFVGACYLQVAVAL